MKQFLLFENVIKKELYFHLLFWSVYIMLPFFKYVGNDYFYTQWILNNSNTPLTIGVAYGCYFMIFSLKNYRILILIMWLSIMTIAGVFISKYIIDLYIFQLNNYTLKSHVFSILSEYIVVCLIFYSFYNTKKSYNLSNSLKVAELENLKAQINPHFLLNTLNSIYLYTLKNDKKASELILKLADNFKYVLREGKQEKVTLKADWNHVNDFIKIHQLRWKDKITFEIEEEIEEELLFISPLILITFVENAIKYTSKLRGNNRIVINLKVLGEQLEFFCKNKYDPNSLLSKGLESDGIGLENTKKRLALLYPQRHHLQIDKKETCFAIVLKIEL